MESVLSAAQLKHLHYGHQNQWSCYFLWVCVFAFLQCTPLCHHFKCLTCSPSIFSSSLLYSLTQVLHCCSGTRSDSLDKWTLDAVEFLPWTFLPRRALSCLSFRHQPLMSTLHWRNLIFVPIKFNICQWVQRSWGEERLNTVSADTMQKQIWI